MTKTDEFALIIPDDWHVHLRDGYMLSAVAPLTARQFARAIVMPNLGPPVTTASSAEAYKGRIMAALPENPGFMPLMTCYLTDDTDPGDLIPGFRHGVFTAAKLYPAGATTNSENGVTDIAKIDGVLGKMQDAGMPLLLHGEVTDPEIDVYDREAVFIERTLAPLLERFPGLKMVFEHITTSQAVDFVTSGPENLAATVTVHHLMINRSDMFKGGLRPHLYCLPVAKRDSHRVALRKAVTSGNAKFFLGTDSAPHAVSAKEADCGCAGVFSAATALELYAQVFDEEDALDQFEAFASLNGPAFYGLPVNEGAVTLKKTERRPPADIEVSGGETIKPFNPGGALAWTLVDCPED